MKLLLIGDPHLKISKFDISCKFLIWIGEVVRATRPDYVINLGDTFDTHSVIRSEIIGEFQRHINEVASITPYIYVLGNHDMYKPNDSKYHALQTIHHDGLMVVTEPWNCDGVTYVPYVPDHKQFPTDLNNICVAHQTFTGVDYGFYRPDLGVDADVLCSDIVISGHIHKRQSFGKVIYPGTPFAQNANDMDQSKGVMLFDTDTYKYSYIESPFPKWRSMVFEARQDLSMKEIHETIVSGINSTDNWLIDITAPRAELAAYLNSKQVLSLQKDVSIRFKPTYNDSDKQLKVKIKSTSMSEVVSEYVDRVYQGSIEKSAVKTKALEVLAKKCLT